MVADVAYLTSQDHHAHESIFQTMCLLLLDAPSPLPPLLSRGSISPPPKSRVRLGKRSLVWSLSNHLLPTHHYLETLTTRMMMMAVLTTTSWELWTCRPLNNSSIPSYLLVISSHSLKIETEPVTGRDFENELVENMDEIDHVLDSWVVDLPEK